jgi:hypothetical protein
MVRWIVVVVAVTAGLPPGPAWGWGTTGHEWATGIAIEKLPDDIPAFVRDPVVCCWS